MQRHDTGELFTHRVNGTMEIQEFNDSSSGAREDTMETRQFAIAATIVLWHPLLYTEQ